MVYWRHVAISFMQSCNHTHTHPLSTWTTLPSQDANFTANNDFISCCWRSAAVPVWNWLETSIHDFLPTQGSAGGMRWRQGRTVDRQPANHGQSHLTGSSEFEHGWFRLWEETRVCLQKSVKSADWLSILYLTWAEAACHTGFIMFPYQYHNWICFSVVAGHRAERWNLFHCIFTAWVPFGKATSNYFC